MSNVRIEVVAEVPAEVKPKISLVRRQFSGQNKSILVNWFGTLRVHGLSIEEATLIAMDAASDFGNAMNKDSELAAKVGKAKKAGESNFKISGTSGYVTTSRSMSMIRFFQQLEGLEKEGICNRSIEAKRLLSKSLTEYLDSVTKRADEIDWKDASE